MLKSCQTVYMLQKQKGYAVENDINPTVPTFNFCNKWVGCLGNIHDHTPDCHPGSCTWMTSKLNVALIRKLLVLGSLMCLAYFLTCDLWLFVQPGTDRRPVDWCRNQMSALYQMKWNDWISIHSFPPTIYPWAYQWSHSLWALWWRGWEHPEVSSPRPRRRRNNGRSGCCLLWPNRSPSVGSPRIPQCPNPRKIHGHRAEPV